MSRLARRVASRWAAYSGPDKCPNCKGTGFVNMGDCPECGGTGRLGPAESGGMTRDELYEKIVSDAKRQTSDYPGHDPAYSPLHVNIISFYMNAAFFISRSLKDPENYELDPKQTAVYEMAPGLTADEWGELSSDLMDVYHAWGGA